mgnify:CR=1 FL=1
MLRSLLALLVVLISACACGEGSKIETPVRVYAEQGDICEYILMPQTDDTCKEKQAWERLADRADRRNLPSDQISLFAGGDPVQQVKKLWEDGFIPPGRDLGPWPFELPVDWNADPFDDRNWRFHLHAWRMIDPMLMAWERTHEKRYLQEAIQVMLDWYDFHFQRGLESQFQWYDMSVGLRAMKLAYVLDKIMLGKVTADLETRQSLVHMAHAHGQSLTDPTQLSKGNHGLFQLHGLMALCSVVPDVSTCKAHETYIETEMKDLLLCQFSSEGVHLEGSPEYHFFAFNTVNSMLKGGWYEEFDFVGDLMEKAKRNRTWMVHPDKTVVTVGDSEPKKVKLKFPRGKQHCRNNSKHGQECTLLKSFEQSGYAVVRSDWSVPKDQASMLFFMAMFHNPGHKLPDDLSFEWYGRGGRILTNAGKYSYNKDNWRDYVTSTRAHNTVEIDRKSFSTRRADAYGSALNKVSRHGDVFVLQGEVEHKLPEQPGRLNDFVPNWNTTNHTRTLVYRPGRWLAVLDAMDSGRSRDYTQWFHFAPNIKVQEKDDRKFLARKEDGTDIFIEHCSRLTKSSLLKGQMDPFLQGWTTKDYGRMQPRYSLGFTCRGKEKIMATLLGFSKNELQKARQTLNRLIQQDQIKNTADGQ